MCSQRIPKKIKWNKTIRYDEIPRWDGKKRKRHGFSGKSNGHGSRDSGRPKTAIKAEIGEEKFRGMEYTGQTIKDKMLSRYGTRGREESRSKSRIKPILGLITSHDD